MIKSKYWYWTLTLVLLIIQVVLGQNEKFSRLVASYATGIDEIFYPFIPQLFLMMGREQVISNLFNSFDVVIEKYPGTANLWMFESIKGEISEIKNSMEENILNLGDKYNIKFAGDNKFKSFQDFQKDLLIYFKEFGLERAFKIHNEIEEIRKKLMDYKTLNNVKILEQVEYRWNFLINILEFVNKNEGNKNDELRRKINQSITNHFIMMEIPKKTEFDVKNFDSDFSNEFWDGHLSNYKLLALFHEYSIQQINLLYKQKLIWLRIHLTVGIIDSEGFLNKVHKSASNTMVHSISLTSLQYLYQIKDRIDFFLLNESYLDQLLDIYDNLSIAMNRWMGQTLVLDDLQYLYTHLKIECLDIRKALIHFFDRIKQYGQTDLIVLDKKSKKNKKLGKKNSGFLTHLPIEWDITTKLENDLLSLIREIEIWKGKSYPKVKQSGDILIFRDMITSRVNMELEEEIKKNDSLYEDHTEFYLYLERIEQRYMTFVRKSIVFLDELKSTSNDCQTLYFSASQAGTLIYEIVASEILKTSNRSGRINMNSSKQLKSLIKDLEFVKESIDTVKKTEEDSDATDILGESISDEDFIYVPGTVGSFKKSQTTSGYLIFRISVIVGLLIVAIILYIYKDKILVKKFDNSEESEIYERYCSRVSLDEIEFNSSQNGEHKMVMKKNKYYKVDNKSGNIILKQQK
ncbi:hypothetical protein [Cryptosporidium parvum Iowa II]|uniref:Uncharacterized protein n=2 Tax=Cryptosporidium parvum TaxID=5807 RepID=Q5CV21_CRYPI|nr:hypothetical protein [Cryptosporidium parvum Iowa II]EAK89203.1 hypothetical protein with a signal peptide plus transmembrane domain near C-terminus [Cryptosporidium parvum Iowa II]QOY42407.1 Uncharacterized protein CPATCC_0031470 [Cryptosporidium parvum]WKS76799.1 putative signal peptide-containing protein plus transmembrane domain near C-terminus [Cryptosporidium sp. 43IA8]WRK31292.1 Uncharacterized protein cpbgf_300590 [Cryptosporidium parvum]|eukprot:QOY42407.1 hypothetical protein CPATCC_001033 [Cryptosporidium parvum]